MVIISIKQLDIAYRNLILLSYLFVTLDGNYFNKTTWHCIVKSCWHISVLKFSFYTNIATPLSSVDLNWLLNNSKFFLKRASVARCKFLLINWKTIIVCVIIAYYIVSVITKLMILKYCLSQLGHFCSWLQCQCRWIAYPCKWAITTHKVFHLMLGTIFLPCLVVV